ncbi:MAG: SH3 domain-containing protein [Saprospiraceae bacterium]|nr:SH3 domain-containing protein [Saprospiraceae bacterium]
MAALKIKKGKDQTKTFKCLFATLFMVIFYVQMWASNGPGFIEGTQLYVVANSGLTLRLEPKMEAEVLTIAEFGSSVEVLNQPDSLQYLEKVNWVEGRWVYVEYDGIRGYMFDGYLTDLPMPIYEFERCQLDLDLIYPLESWTDVNLGEYEQTEIDAGALKKLTYHFIGGEKMIKSQKGDRYKLELYLNEVRLMDAYHLLQSMIDTKERLEVFKNQSTFIEDREGDLYKVKVNLDNPIVFRKLKSGDIKVTITSDQYACGM